MVLINDIGVQTVQGATPPATQARCNNTQGRPPIGTSRMPGRATSCLGQAQPAELPQPGIIQGPPPQAPATSSQVRRNRRAEAAEQGDDVMMVREVTSPQLCYLMPLLFPFCNNSLFCQ